MLRVMIVHGLRENATFKKFSSYLRSLCLRVFLLILKRPWPSSSLGIVKVGEVNCIPCENTFLSCSRILIIRIYTIRFHRARNSSSSVLRTWAFMALTISTVLKQNCHLAISLNTCSVKHLNKFVL